MTSRSSFFKEVLSELRRSLWAPMLSLIGFLFCVPLPCAVVIQQYYENLPMWEDAMIGDFDPLANTADNIAWFLGSTNLLVALGMFVMATLCGVALFRYLHDRRQVDLFHALPVSRRHLFAVRYMAGIVGVLPIYLALILLTAGTVTAMGFGGELSAGLLARGAAFHIVFFLCLYAVAILCTVLTGNTVITVALGLVATFWVPASALLVNWLQDLFYDTYAGAGPGIARLIAYGSPLISYFLFSGSAQELIGSPELDVFGNVLTISFGRMLVTFLLVAVILTALCLALFCIRRSERAGTAVAFAGAKLPIKVVVCLLAGVVGFLFFRYAFGSFWSWFGLVVLMALAHGVCEIIYHFDFRKVVAHPLHLAVFVALNVAVLCGMQADITGYDKRMPAFEDIAGAQFETWAFTTSFDQASENYMTEPENLEKIYTIACAARDAERSEEVTDNFDFNITFQLKNGRIFKRNYNYITDSDAYDLLREVVGSNEYIRLSSRWQKIDAASIRADRDSRLEIRTAAVVDGGAASAVLLNPEQIAAVIEAMQAADLTHDSALRESEVPVLRMDLEYKSAVTGRHHSETYIPVYAADTEVLALIKECTGVKPEPLTAEKISSLQIIRDVYYYDDEGQDENTDTGAATVAPPEEGSISTLVTDPETIAELLKDAIPQGMMNATDSLFDSRTYLRDEGYRVNYTLIANLSGSEEYLYYAADNCPRALLDQLLDAAETN